jgi:hypothetical protein
VNDLPQQTINTPRETTHQRIADALEDIVDKIVDTISADNIDYNNTQSGLSANKVQGAVDELASEKADKSTTLAGYGITDAYTKAEVYTQSEVNNIVSTLETNIDWKEAVNTYSDIATTYPNPQDGWTVNVKDTDYTYRYNGSEWVAISANAIPEATISVKGLMTPTQVSKLNEIEAGAQVNTVTSVAGKTGTVTLTKSDVGLGNVDNTSDLSKPISTAVQNALNLKANTSDISQSLTATGNPLTIESSESNLVECVAEVEAVQDLHGYDSPWVGGAGKNKLPLTVDGIKAINTSGTWSGNVYTYNNIAYTILTDDGDNVIGIKVNGTTTTRSYLIVGLLDDLIGKSVIMNGCPSGGSIPYTDTGYSIFTGGVGVPQVYDTGNGATFTVSENGGNVNININNVTMNNVMFYPMICLATETDSTFEPYSNISPITGQTEVVIENAGKTYTIQLGDTIYGGELDAITGELRVNKAIKTVSDLSWSLANNVFYATVSDKKYGSDAELITSHYQFGGNYVNTQTYNNNAPDKSAGGATGNATVYVKDSSYTSASSFKTAMGDVQLVYELAEPYTIQLTPQQIRLLKGTNHLSCNTGDLTIKYYPDNVLGQLKGDIEKGLNAYYDYQIQALWDKIGELQA